VNKLPLARLWLRLVSSSLFPRFSPYPNSVPYSSPLRNLLHVSLYFSPPSSSSAPSFARPLLSSSPPSEGDEARNPTHEQKLLRTSRRGASFLKATNSRSLLRFSRSGPPPLLAPVPAPRTCAHSPLAATEGELPTPSPSPYASATVDVSCLSLFVALPCFPPFSVASRKRSGRRGCSVWGRGYGGRGVP